MQVFALWFVWALVVAVGFISSGRLLHLGYPGWAVCLIVSSGLLLSFPLILFLRLERKRRDQDWPAP